MKKFISLFLAFTVCFTMFQFMVSATDTDLVWSLSTYSGAVAYNQNATITVYVNLDQNPGMISQKFDLNFDPNVLQYINYTQDQLGNQAPVTGTSTLIGYDEEGNPIYSTEHYVGYYYSSSLLVQPGDTADDSTVTDFVRWVAAGNSNVTRTGKFMKLKFKVLTADAVATTINFQVADGNLEAKPVTPGDPSIILSSNSPILQLNLNGYDPAAPENLTAETTTISAPISSQIESVTNSEIADNSASKKISAIAADKREVIASKDILKKYKDKTGYFGGMKIVETSKLDPSDENYWVKVYNPQQKAKIEDAASSANKTAKLPSGVTMEDMIADSTMLTSTSSSTSSYTNYNVYSEDNTTTPKYSNIKSVFNAIGKASVSGDYVKETAGLQRTVFTKNSTNYKYYKFVNSNYLNGIGYTDVADEYARQWAENTEYAHVYDSFGHLVFNHYSSIGANAPFVEALEPESGSYYYKFSYKGGYKGTQFNVNFNNTIVNYTSDTDINKFNNIYVYAGVKDTTNFCEMGLITNENFKIYAPDGSTILGGEWLVCINCTNDGYSTILPHKVAATSVYKQNHIYVTNGFNVNFKMIVEENLPQGTVSSNLLTTPYTYPFWGTTISENETGGQLYFQQAVSCVFNNINDDGSVIKTSDLRNNAGMKNLTLSNCNLYYTHELTDTPTPFYSDSDATSIAFLYNDDTIMYNRKSPTQENINIIYSEAGLGDSNLDKSVTAFDAVIVLQVVAGLISPSAVQTYTCDSNRSNAITAYDAVLILQKVAGLATGFPIGDNAICP